MEEKWFLTTKKADFNGIGKRFGIDPVVARIIRNRDIVSEEDIRQFLEGDLSDIPDSKLFADMDKAIDVFQCHRDEKIRIIGDYDIDGVCSTYILVRGLRELRCQVDAAIPHRIQDGYGLNDRLIDEAHDDGVSMIITCDNGISAKAQIAHAKKLGMTVIVTDHHEVPYEEKEGIKSQLLPPADAVVDPKRDDCQYPNSGICGGFVAFHFIRALYERLEYDNQELMGEFAEIAAFATVGDVMQLKGENRILVKEGLSRMKRSANLGLRSLIKVCELSGKDITAYHLGFIIGPCLNATGRLDSAQRALELLMSDSENEAMHIAIELKSMNDSRKDLTAKGVDEAMKAMENWDLDRKPVIVLYLPSVHESLAGIIAGRVREVYNHPTFILTDGEDGIKGSGRSVEGYDMFEELTQVKEYLTKFGGHTLAAGLSLDKAKLDDFINAINEKCNVDKEAYIKKVHIDVNMPLSYVTESFVDQLGILEPFGMGNPKPIFAQSNLSVTGVSCIGNTNRVMKLKVHGEDGREFALTLFSGHEVFDEYIIAKYSKEELEQLYSGNATNVALSVLYYPDINEYKGRRSIQFVVQGYK